MFSFHREKKLPLRTAKTRYRKPRAFSVAVKVLQSGGKERRAAIGRLCLDWHAPQKPPGRGGRNILLRHSCEHIPPRDSHALALSRPPRRSIDILWLIFFPLKGGPHHTTSTHDAKVELGEGRQRLERYVEEDSGQEKKGMVSDCLFYFVCAFAFFLAQLLSLSLAVYVDYMRWRFRTSRSPRNRRKANRCVLTQKKTGRSLFSLLHCCGRAKQTSGWNGLLFFLSSNLPLPSLPRPNIAACEKFRKWPVFVYLCMKLLVIMRWPLLGVRHWKNVQGRARTFGNCSRPVGSLLLLQHADDT